MLKALDPYKWLALAALLAVLALAIWGYGQYQYQQGKSTAETAASVAREAEVARQLEVNREAQRSAALTISALRTTTQSLEDQLKENARVAALDPLADSCGLSPDGVRRIGTIGRTPSPPRRPFGIGGGVPGPGDPPSP